MSFYININKVFAKFKKNVDEWELLTIADS